MDKEQNNSGLSSIEGETDVVYSSKNSIRRMYLISEAMAITVHTSEETTTLKVSLYMLQNL